ncbi:MAG: hypothetical protein MMC23_000588 [Stictis urceolatum]|nr:hypothetical protein [Stictis urceolata]
MPKKRKNASFNKPPSSVHPSLSSAAASASAGPSTPKASSVNELIQQSRRTHSTSKIAAADALSPTPTMSHFAFASPVVHEAQVPTQHPPLNPRNQMAARRRARRPPGPAPPPSWTSSRHLFGSLYASRYAPYPARRSHRFSAPSRQPGQSIPVPLLPEQLLPPVNSLQDLILQSIARDWTWHLENDGAWLDVIPMALKSALLFYLVRLGRPITTSDLRLLLYEEEPEDLGEWEADVEQKLTHLSIGPSIGTSPNCSWKQLTALCSKPAVNSTTPSSSKTLPESWDSPSQKTTSEASSPHPNQLPSSLPSPLHNLTHLSLAHVLPTHQSYNSLLSLTSHLPYLTHLSLAHWDLPPDDTSLPCNAIGNKSFRTPSSIRSTDNAAAQTMKRLGKAAPRLEWLDLSGNPRWISELQREPVTPDGARPNEPQWVSMLTAVRTIKLGPCGCGVGECSVPEALRPYPADVLERSVGEDLGMADLSLEGSEQQDQHGDMSRPYFLWMSLPKPTTATMKVRELLALVVGGLILELSINDGRRRSEKGRLPGCVVDMGGGDVGGRRWDAGAGGIEGEGLNGGREDEEMRENRLAPWVRDIANSWRRGQDVKVGWSWAEYDINMGP